MIQVVVATRRPPAGHSYAHEGLQAAKVALAFDVPTALLLLDEGVWHLAGGPGSRHAAELAELRQLGCRRIVVDAAAVAVAGLGDATEGVECASRREIAALLRSADVVLTY
jgi:sulfur relay (sulfurtransferase) DsrF/TusC family protein